MLAKDVREQKEAELKKQAPVGSFVRFNGIETNGTAACNADNVMKRLAESNKSYQVLTHQWYGDELLIRLRTTENKEIQHFYDYWFPTAWLDLKPLPSDPPWSVAIAAPILAILGITALSRPSKNKVQNANAVKVKQPEDHKLTK
jgi:hypothetical protein